MKFNFKAEDKKGRILEGVAEAPDKFSLASQIRKEGKNVILVKEIKTKKFFDIDALNEILAKVKLHDKIVFTRNLSAMVEAGLSLPRALNTLQRQTKNLKFKKILKILSEKINKGETLSSGMAEFPKVFSSLFVSMVKAGEESGGLSESLRVIGSHLEKSYNLKRKVRGALMYPAIIIVAMFIIGILMLINVVPTLTSTFSELNVELPTSTQFIISFSDFLIAHTLLFLSIVVSVILFVSFTLQTKKGKRFFDFVALHLPLVSNLVKEYNSALTARSLSSLLSSGLDIVESIEIVSMVVQNSYYREVLKKAKEGVQKGNPLSRSFMEREDLYPILMGEMVEVGEETGKTPGMLMRVAIFYEGEIDNTTKNMSTIIEPFLMIIIGVVVGFFAISMISPMYSLMDSI